MHNGNVSIEKDQLSGEEMVKLLPRRTSSPWVENEIALGCPIANPPCVMPWAPPQDLLVGPSIDEKVEDTPYVADYWKSFATVSLDWPDLQEHRKTHRKFANAWTLKDVNSKMRAFVAVQDVNVGVRSRPHISPEFKTGQIMTPGSCIVVEDVKEFGGLSWLRMPGVEAGWVLAANDGTDLFREMRNIEAGLWWYMCIAESPVEIRKCPSFSDSTRSGYLLSPTEFLVVDMRIKLNGYNYFHLRDGRGWVFELKPGTLKNDRKSANVVMTLCDDEFAGIDEGFEKFVVATNHVVEVGDWTYVVNMEPVLCIGALKNGFFLSPGSIVKVMKRANSSGYEQERKPKGLTNRLWLQLSDGSGWVPETDEKGGKLLIEQKSDNIAYPNWYKPGANPNYLSADDAWQMGSV